MEKTPIGLSCPFFNGNESKYVNDCLESSWISTGGSYVNRFEQAVADYLHIDSACACVNGTAALHISLIMAGVKSKQEVLVPDLTFIAPINAVRYINAIPVFLDCDDSLNLDIDKLQDFLDNTCDFSAGILMNCKTGREIKAIIPVHIFGGMCDMNRLMPLAKKYKLTVIEDATEALGSRMNTGEYAGRHAGTIGDYGTYSFNGNKIITTGGGGMLVSSPERVARAKYLTTQAKDDELHYIHDAVGYNYRLPALPAALGLAQLEELDSFIAAKKKRFEQYRQAVEHIAGLSMIQYPSYCDSNHWFFSLMIDPNQYGLDRDGLLQAMAAEKIQTRPIWQLNHLQKPYREFQTYKIEKAQYYFEHILNIPCSPSLTDEEMERVIEVLQQGARKRS